MQSCILLVGVARLSTAAVKESQPAGTPESKWVLVAVVQRQPKAGSTRVVGSSAWTMDDGAFARPICATEAHKVDVLGVRRKLLWLRSFETIPVA